jgi:hypothetical protein
MNELYISVNDIVSVSHHFIFRLGNVENETLSSIVRNISRRLNSLGNSIMSMMVVHPDKEVALLLENHCNQFSNDFSLLISEIRSLYILFSTH